jgi:conserved oligomeric Golgi complex subunit 6
VVIGDSFDSKSSLTIMSSNPNEGQSILSEKVTRALAVRTDTIAMKSALEALAYLDSNSNKSGAVGTTTTAVSSNWNTVVDSRSVRTAMEHDAFAQALALQAALADIVESVTAVRQGCRQVAQTAAKVKAAISMPVITAETANTMLPSGGTNTAAAASADTASSMLESGNASASLDAANPLVNMMEDNDAAATYAEQKLAERLSDAFVHRDQARQRLQAVHAFMDTFDLSEQDSALLDHYNFADISSSVEDGGAALVASHDGFAFLNALHRVRKIRQALHQTFGSDNVIGSGGGGGTNDGGLGTSSALRMLENLSQKQENAYERLYHWLQQYLQLSSSSNFDGGAGAGAGYSNEYVSDFAAYREDGQLASSSSSSLPLNDFVLQALYTLRHVPAFYNHLTELIAANRRANVTRNFLLALTTGTPEAPPMEMKAHDSVACTLVLVRVLCVICSRYSS